MKKFVHSLIALASASMPLLAQPVITSQPTNQIILSGGNVMFSVMVNGTGPFTYQWQFNGTNLPFTNIITTVAGTNSSGFTGDGGAAINAKLNFPYSVVVDQFGNILIADSNNNRIRKVATNGIITMVAGTSSSGFAGDGGAASIARLYNPYGVSVDSLGNILIADTFNNRIRKIDTNGMITTVAGTNSSGFGGDGGAANIARLNNPNGVSVDSLGNILIADTSNNRIRKVDTNGVITTLAGTNASGFAGDGGAASIASLARPYGVSLDSLGNILIADTFHSRIRKVDSNGIISTIAGTGFSGYSGDGGAATNAMLYFPSDLTLDAYGNLLIADSNNHRIRKIDLAGSPMLKLNSVTTNNVGSYQVVITSLSGSVTSSIVTLTVGFPPSLTAQTLSQAATNGGPANFNVVVSGTMPFGYQWYFNTNTAVDGGTNTVLSIASVDSSTIGSYFCVITNDYGSITSRVVSLAIALPPVFVKQPTNQTVVSSGNVTFSTSVSGTGPFTYQWQLNGTNLPNNIITTVAGNGSNGFSGDGGVATNASFDYPAFVALDGSGNLFISDAINNRIRKVDTNGIISSIVGNGNNSYGGDGGWATNAGIDTPTGLAADAYGNLFLGDSYNNRIRKVDGSGIITTVAGKGTSGVFGGYSGDAGVATNASISFPAGVAVDTVGNLFIADSENNRIRKVDPSGIITTVAGKGGGGYSGDGGVATNARLNFPNSVAADGAGNFFIADAQNNRIRKVDTSGIIITLAGNGTTTYTGDGGMATNAGLSAIRDVKLDSFGNLYIADFGHHCIRMVDANGIITTVAGNGISGYSGDGDAATNASLKYPNGVALDAAGNLFIADSGNQRIREVAFAGNPALTLNNTTTNNAGSYTVSITSPYGSVTSSNATLTVIVPPNISAFTTSNGIFNFTWNAQSNYTYQLQCATNLVAPDWQNVGSPNTATNGTVSAAHIPGTDAPRFYRVQLVQ